MGKEVVFLPVDGYEIKNGTDISIVRYSVRQSEKRREDSG
jgi:hypothetical protein